MTVCQDNSVGEKSQSFQQIVLRRDTYMQQNEIDLLSYNIYKNQIKSLNAKAQTRKLLEEIVDINLCDHELHNSIRDTALKV
jgi:hypothetical protein